MNSKKLSEFVYSLVQSAFQLPGYRSQACSHIWLLCDAVHWFNGSGVTMHLETQSARICAGARHSPASEIVFVPNVSGSMHDVPTLHKAELLHGVPTAPHCTS